MVGKYDKSAREIAEMFGYKIDRVRNLCHARGQKFAVQFATNGNFYIDADRFREYVERKNRI